MDTGAFWRSDDARSLGIRRRESALFLEPCMPNATAEPPVRHSGFEPPRLSGFLLAVPRTPLPKRSNQRPRDAPRSIVSRFPACIASLPSTRRKSSPRQVNVCASEAHSAFQCHFVPQGHRLFPKSCFGSPMKTLQQTERSNQLCGTRTRKCFLAHGWAEWGHGLGKTDARAGSRDSGTNAVASGIGDPIAVQVGVIIRFHTSDTGKARKPE